MPDNERLPHLRIDRFVQSRIYRYPRTVVGNFEVVERNRRIHGNAILRQLNQIRDQYQLSQEVELPREIVRDEVVYVEFVSAVNFPLKFESLHQDRSNPRYQILSIKEERVTENGVEAKKYRVLVMMKPGGISAFITKVNQYLTENTRDREGRETDTPRHEPLINNVETIQLATLQSFWTDEPEIPFPSIDDVVWWEVWFRRTNADADRISRVVHNLSELEAQIGEETLEFPEHIVRLVRASARQLSSSLLLLDNLAELRKPQQINDFITGESVTYDDQRLWLQDLQNRTDVHIGDNSIIICVLDSGVNNQHPLLTPLLPDGRMFAYKSAWGTNDTWRQGGHGTPVAGLAAYGDLTEALASRDRIRIYHGLESFKIVHPDDPNAPASYGSITEYAAATPAVDFPNNKRIYCMAVTDRELAFRGRPSSWSAAVDKIAFGSIFDPVSPQLFIVSGGNIDYLNNYSASDYPDRNLLESVHDPGQAYNALVIGGYTRMDRVDQNVWQQTSALARAGGMSPCNSTSLTWENQWL